MGQLEHLLNVHAAKHAPGSCAEFLGYSEVAQVAAVSDKRITPGTWLVRQGGRTGGVDL